VRADGAGRALELEGLEARPVQEVLVRARELAEVLGEVLLGVTRAGLLRRRDLGRGVLADGLVASPVKLLAVGGL
jgi:hypothetical protein